MLKMTKIELVSATFNVKSKKAAPFKVDLSEYKKIAEKKKADCFRIKYRLSFTVDSEQKDFFRLSCSFESSYECDDKGRELLKEHIVVAHAISYLREFVSNMTMRSPLPTVVIDPANALMLWKDYKDGKE